MLLRIDKRKKSLMGKARAYYDENGLIKTLLRVTEISLEKVINTECHYIIERSLSSFIPNIKAKLDVTFRIAEAQDIGYFKDILKPWNYWFGVTLRRFEKGQTCILCFHENRAIGYVWISFVPETDRNTGLTIQTQEDESYGFDLFVLPEYRKFLVGYELISRWLQYSKEAGKAKAIGVVAAWNKPMQMTTKLVFGFKVIRKVRSVELFRKKGFIISSEEID